MRYAIVVLLTILLLMIAGCAAPTCYPPNKILGNNCCLDEDDNDVCDYEEEGADEEPEELVIEPEEEEEVEYAPQIQEVEVPEPAPIRTGGYEFGVSDINLGESRDPLQLNKMSAFRTSRDKGMMDWMVFTVRNKGQTKLNAEVELFFEGARIEEHSTRVKKEYTIPELAPGEKYVVNKSLGIRFSEINKSKKITMKVYEKFVAPREDLDVLTKEFIPQDLFESMEIYYYDRPGED